MAKGSPSKSRSRAPPPPEEVEDDYLEDDSEVDEFAEDYDSDDQDHDGEDSAGSEEDEEEGTGRWEADDWDENDDDDSKEDSQSGSDEDDDDAIQLKRLQNDLTSLPLSTLAKAQKSLSSSSKQRSSSSSSGSSKEDKLQAIKAKLAQMQKGKGKATTVDPYSQSSTARDGGDAEHGSDSDSDSGPEMGSTKRGSKHAPTAMSTKKQVSRNRQVVDVHKPQRLDPRFSSMSAGNLDAHLHSASYSFLPSMLKEELSSLKTALVQAQKVERTCPWAEKPARTAEREKIELQLGRVRTRLVKSDNEERERNVLAKMKREEREKREQGKGAWYMKKSEKRDLLLKSKFESLEAKGGKTAVKKAMEKKRKKIASKEKKSRPFAPGGGTSEGGARKRQRV